MKQRKHHRFEVEFNSYFATTKAVEGLGVVMDLSAEGCHITSSTPLRPEIVLRLRVSLAELNLHIQVAKAEVRWVQGTQFGVEFTEMSDENRQYLQQALIEFKKTPLS